MKIIVGLGNPGKKYENTRHNIGFIILDWILDYPEWQENKKLKSLVYEKNSNLYIKPQTYMNNSGEPVSRALNYNNLIPKKLGLFAKKNLDLQETLIVIHDDLDIELGKIKISENSSSAGHKGVANIITHIKTKNFIRIRIGIKKSEEYKNIPVEKYVLMPFSKEEIRQIKETWDNSKNLLKEKADLDY